ncbi:MAG: subtilase [Acidimicrobiales bacterium]|nr:subtilase [Acidimicrobiales bacterium]
MDNHVAWWHDLTSRSPRMVSRRDGGTGMRQYRHTVVTFAALTAVAVGAAACATDGVTPQRAVDARPVSYLGADPSPTSAPLWSDDLVHLVVTTTSAPSATTAGDNGPSRPTHAARDQVVEDAIEVTLHHADGTIVTLRLPAGSLTAVEALPDEQAAFDAAGVGAAVVVDLQGLLGAAGGRYLLIDHQLTELGTGTVGTATATSDSNADSGPLVVGSGAHGDDDAAIAAQIGALDGVQRVEVVGPGIISVSGDPAANGLSDQIAAVDGVTDVRSDILLSYADDTYQNQQWALANTGSSSQTGGRYPGVAGADVAASAAWTITRGAGVTVAVIDSGVQPDQPDLSAQLWTNPGEASCTNGVDDDHNGFVDDCAGWDFGNNDKNPTPDPSANETEHGTHVAGIIAAAQNGIGTVGVAPGAKIMAVKVGNTSGGITGSAVAAGINYAVANGARVINMSLATSPGTPRAAAAPIENAVNAATAAGVVVVVAAGNDGIDISNGPGWPAGYSLYNPGVITVGANTNSDTRASFSNTGTPVDIQAPGFWIVSTVIGGWAYMSGTSMASPYVAGGAALVLASGTATTPAAVRTRLVATSENTAGGKRMNVAFAVGTTRAGGPAKTTSVSYSGTNTLVPDADGNVGLGIAANAASGVTQFRLSVATRDGSNIAAVEGLSATFSDGSGAIGTRVTSDVGAFPITPLRDTAALQSSGTTVRVGLNLPAGEYAFVTELLEASGVAVNGAQVAYLSVSSTPPGSSGTIPASTVSTSPITTSPSSGATTPTTRPTGPSTSAPTGGGSGGGTGTTTAPGSGGGSGGGGSGGGASGGGSGGAGGAGGSTPSTAAPTTSTPRTPTATTSPTTGTTQPPRTTTPTRPTTPTTTATTASTAPATTLPPLPGASDGAFSIGAMSPRTSADCGGGTMTIDGVIPRLAPMYVWFGNAVASTWSEGNRVTVRIPPNIGASVVDVTLKFEMGRKYSIKVAQSFTYTPSPVSCWAGPSTTAPRSGGSTGSGGSGGSTGTTTATTTPSTRGTTPPASTAPATTAPATTAPAPAPATTSPRAPLGTRGRLTLRSISSGVLTGLRTGTWPSAGCHDPSCATSSL